MLNVTIKFAEHEAGVLTRQAEVHGESGMNGFLMKVDRVEVSTHHTTIPFSRRSATYVGSGSVQSMLGVDPEAFPAGNAPAELDAIRVADNMSPEYRSTEAVRGDLPAGHAAIALEGEYVHALWRGPQSEMPPALRGYLQHARDVVATAEPSMRASGRVIPVGPNDSILDGIGHIAGLERGRD